jgi:L-amino acid N-acyltransferase YncA
VVEYTIRAATADDAAGIAAVAAAVWPEEPLDAARIGALMAAGARRTLVAASDGATVGFADGFMTGARDGAPRWEVDLLAVGPRAQGHGIGRALIAGSVAAGRELGAARARALIRAGNIGSERAFAACGFQPEPFESELWVADGVAVPDVIAGLTIVPVRTFRYAGIWLEDVSAAGLGTLRLDTTGGIVGAVIPLSGRDALRAAAAAAMQREGRFRFWHHAPVI